MLLDLPDECGPPSVRVNNELYFTNELLQLESRQYFIPQRYFRIQDPLPTFETREGTQCEKKVPGELYALGWPVSRSAVCSK